MGTFKAWVVDKNEAGQSLAFRDFDDADLMDGDVTVRVTHSTLNYKDGLALTGKSPVVRRFPMIPGIDFSGIVETSDHPDYRPGDAVVLTGWGVGETHLGAYAQRARVRGDWLVPLPQGLTAEQAMAVGTAGYTAMLCCMALDAHGVKPEHGPVIVTGASAYSRVIDWARFRAIADKCGALLMSDIAHYAGLVATGLYPSPVAIAWCASMTAFRPDPQTLLIVSAAT